MYYYSQSTRGFYHTEFNPVIPNDAISISDLEYKTLHEGLANGKQIKVVDGTATLVDSSETLTWKEVRSRRNNLLSTSDYSQLPDFPGDKEAWAVYRKQLRDIPQTFTQPKDVVWPVKPNS